MRENFPHRSLALRRAPYLCLKMMSSMMPYSLRLLGIHDEVAFHVALDLLQPLTAVLGQHLVGDLAHAQDLAGMNIDVGRLAGKPDISG